MMRFANDAELVGVLGHEIAHNAMGHIEARKKNALLGGLLGAILDVAAATQGVNTQGQNTANFMAAAARAFSQDFEREADYVGM
jgi:predicted Zn-dependent protease